MTGGEWKAMALRVLRHVEWRGRDRYEEFCANYECGRAKELGHAPDCELGLLLAEVDAVDCVTIDHQVALREELVSRELGNCPYAKAYGVSWAGPCKSCPAFRCAGQLRLKMAR